MCSRIQSLYGCLHVQHTTRAYYEIGFQSNKIATILTNELLVNNNKLLFDQNITIFNENNRNKLIPERKRQSKQVQVHYLLNTVLKCLFINNCLSVSQSVN